MSYFDSVDPHISFPSLEEKILLYWKENKIFEQSVEQRPASKTWTFLDGPPFITGLPHYGSLLSSIPKDVFPRFWTMKGYRVRRVWGWDCHGLPAENKVETKLGITRKKDIEEKVGVKTFIDECKAYVGQVSTEWEWYIDHVARWVDFKNAYRTMDTSYMESVMWVFKQMYEKGFIYKGLRVSLYCPHCSTPISNFEVAMDPDNYKEITEPANTYKYKIVGEEVYLLAWSTTPWNKLATPALAVNPALTYVQVKQGDEHYILAKNTLSILTSDPYTIEKEFSGTELVGKSFEPHYSFYEIEEGKKAFVVIPGDFVTESEGTGIVTIAAYGEEDLAAMKEHNIQIVLHVDDEGMLKKDIPEWGGMYYLDVNEKVNADLVNRGLMYKESPHTHTIPTCWRCHTRLFYAPQNAWYVDVQKLKPALRKNNEFVNWFPEHFKMGRFLNSVEAAPDWCISRSRYWGSPVPVWECECGERFVAGSISELEEKSGKTISDLHKPEIDDVMIPCEKCGKSMKRVPEVLDSWIEAGSASFAERHFPFEKDTKLEDFFPPDFIVEYTGQIRAWFYVLHVISTALYDTFSFKNVLVTGVILGTDGRKMSKNYGNYPDPKELLMKYGGDALRLYLLSTPVMRGEDIVISEENYKVQIREFMLILWNVYNFFVTYATLDSFTPTEKDPDSQNPLDRWILASLSKFSIEYTAFLESYDTVSAIDRMKSFLTKDLSGWYIRRSRNRVGVTATEEGDKQSFYETCYYVLTRFLQLSAPILPFLTEELYRNLTKTASVHLTDWPTISTSYADESLLTAMELAREIVERGHALRKTEAIALKQPLLSVHSSHEIPEDLTSIVCDELNVKQFIVTKEKESPHDLFVTLDTTITPELEEEAKARELIRSIQQARKEMGIALTDSVTVTAPWLPTNSTLLDWIKKKTLTTELTSGEFRVTLV
jgi:isoleucyl-tRNA synthetase